MSTGDDISIRVGKDRWNHNIHYGLRLLNFVPKSPTRALDVGCGEGWLTRELSERFEHVVGLDPDADIIALARTAAPSDRVEFVVGDLLTCSLEPSSFDFITCVAALHHLDEEAGLRRLVELLRPGGTLGVVGLARSRLPADLPWEIAGAVATRTHKITKRYWETPAPRIWPPPHTYGEVRELSQRIMPGSKFRRRVLWRYVLTWTKPGH